MGKKNLYDRLAQFNERIESAVENENNIALVSSLNADGMCASGIASVYIFRLGGKCSVRTVSELTPETLAELESSGYDLFLIMDFGNTTASKLRNSLGTKWLLIDHESIVDGGEENPLKDQNDSLTSYGVDAEREISSGGLVYLLALEASNKNKDLSKLAVVSALAEKQDVGEKKSLVGLNSEIAKSSVSIGALSVKSGLLLAGETMPIHEAIAGNLSPYIDGLTWNYENSYSLVKKTGLQMRNLNGQWRRLTDLDHEEQGILAEAIIKFIVTNASSTLPVADDLTGSVYSLREDPQTSLRDARQYVELLNACGSSNKGGIGVGICMGDRNAILEEGERIFSAYKTSLQQIISRIFSEKWRFNDYGECLFVVGEGAVHETMINPVCSFLVGCLTLNNKLLLVRTITRDNSRYKFSMIRGFRSKFPPILGDLLKSCSESIGSIVTSGRLNSATCEIPLTNLDEFMVSIRSRIRYTRFEG
ncbi:MAG TPA: single-stranded DNA exonuclease RecJ [Nitrososphaeraceae archaeon]|jgi:RecJ-like exonuclease